MPRPIPSQGSPSPSPNSLLFETASYIRCPIPICEGQMSSSVTRLNLESPGRHTCGCVCEVTSEKIT